MTDPLARLLHRLNGHATILADLNVTLMHLTLALAQQTQVLDWGV